MFYGSLVNDLGESICAHQCGGGKENRKVISKRLKKRAKRRAKS